MKLFYKVNNIKRVKPSFDNQANENIESDPNTNTNKKEMKYWVILSLSNILTHHKLECSGTVTILPDKNDVLELTINKNQQGYTEFKLYRHFNSMGERDSKLYLNKIVKVINKTKFVNNLFQKYYAKYGQIHSTITEITIHDYIQYWDRFWNELPHDICEKMKRKIKNNSVRYFFQEYIHHHNITISTDLFELLLSQFSENVITIIDDEPIRLLELKLKIPELFQLMESFHYTETFKMRVFMQYFCIEWNRRGNTCIYQKKLKSNTIHLFEKYQSTSTDMDILYDQTLTNALHQSQLFLFNEYIYLFHKYKEELYIAKCIQTLLSKPNSYSTDIEQIQEKHYQLDASNDYQLSLQQVDAVFNAFQHSISIIYGKPGTGKSSVLKQINQIYEKIYTDGTSQPMSGIIYLAPTAKARIRISSIINNATNTYTIHKFIFSVLGRSTNSNNNSSNNDSNTTNSDNDTKLYQHITSNHPIIIVIDEFSMVGNYLFWKLLSSLNEMTKHYSILLIGDPNQLESIDSGELLYQLIQNEMIPKVELQIVHRHGNESHIYNALEQIQRGELISPHNYTDFEWIQEITDEKIFQICSNQLNEYFHQMNKKLTLCPTHSAIKYYQPIIQKYYHQLYQQSFHQQSTNQEIIQSKTGGNIQIGDQIIYRINDYNYDVYNGMVGQIINIQERPYCCIHPEHKCTNQNATEECKFINEKNITYHFHEDADDTHTTITYQNGDNEVLNNISLAYLQTIHSAQGSEAEHVVIYLPPTSYQFITRNMLYTAISRAKKKCILIANLHTITHAIQNIPPKRNTHISTLIACDNTK